MAKSCYMCENESTSVEHVPPKCIFPEQKDLHEEVDLRKNLITVPSCDLHNSKKSKDDEYLFYCLAVSLLSNKYAINQFATKITRAIERNPNLIRQFLSNSTSVILEDQKGFRYPSMGIFIDRERLNKIFQHIGYALYNSIKSLKWKKNVFVHPEFLMYLQEENRIELNDKMACFSADLDKYFAPLDYYGENQDVFKFQYLESEKDFTIRLYFYGDSKVTIFLTARDLAKST